jgi:hypothetical protein
MVRVIVSANGNIHSVRMRHGLEYPSESGLVSTAIDEHGQIFSLKVEGVPLSYRNRNESWHR